MGDGDYGQGGAPTDAPTDASTASPTGKATPVMLNDIAFLLLAVSYEHSSHFKFEWHTNLLLYMRRC